VFAWKQTEYDGDSRGASVGESEVGEGKIASQHYRGQRQRVLQSCLGSVGDAHDVQLFFIRPGRPVENGIIESFNGRLRDECLNVEWFVSLADARRSWPSFVRITITSGRTAHWRIERRRHSRSYTGVRQKKLVHRWGETASNQVNRTVEAQKL
jgi:transposase InsO family protein